jgi:hypothetical protein
MPRERDELESMMYYTHGDESSSITIRLAQPADRDGVRRVAQRDSRGVPDDQLLIAVDAGEVRAAIAVESGDVIADPFHRTEELVRMLDLRRSQLARELRTPRRGLRPLRLASS